MGAKFIHTADIHLKKDEPFRLDLLSWVLSKAKQLADALIIAGDLFESDIEASFLREKVRGIFEKAKPFPVLIIPGNHDYLSYSSETYYGDNVVPLHGKLSQVNIKGVRITGVPFQPQLDFTQCMERLESRPKSDLVVAHGTLYERKSPDIYMELGDDAKYMPIYRWQVEDKMKYLALGHYHSRFIHLTFGKTEVVYPGSPLVTSRRSVGTRFVALVQTEGEEVKVEKVPVEISTCWEREEWMVFPGREEEKLGEIEEEIEKKVNGKIMLQGKVKGSIKMGEREFTDKLRQIEEKYRSRFKSIHLSCEVKHWAYVIQNPTVALFIEKLQDKECDELLRERALELVLSALERLRK